MVKFDRIHFMDMKTTRRNFLIGLGATLAMREAAFAEAAADGVLPEFYVRHLEDVAARVAAGAAKGAAHGFTFFTDPHIAANYGRSGFLIADLVRRTGLGRVICGGDWSAAFCAPKAPKPFVERLCAKMNSHWRDPIEAAGGAYFTAKGNHDMRVWDSWDKKDGFVYASARTREIMMATKESANVVVNADEKSGMYFYRDDAKQKVRYIVADTSDGTLQEDRSGTGEGYGNFMREDQLKWLGEVALGTVPAGYGVVVVHHIPLTPFTGSAHDAKVFADLRRTLEAYQSRGRVETKAGPFDFSARKGGDILFDLAGHTHSDQFSFCNGILHISDTCDAYYRDPGPRTPFSGNLVTDRKLRKGTVNEQAFDVFRFGGGAVRTTRVGVGQDRVFRLKPVTLKVGEKVRLDCGEFADVKWRGFDSWDAKEDRKENDPEKHWTFQHEIAEVSSDGIVTAKSSGWATAVAIAPDFRKEIVGIEVKG